MARGSVQTSPVVSASVLWQSVRYLAAQQTEKEGTALALGLRGRSRGHLRAAGAFAFGGIPILRREGDAPKQRRGLGEFDPDFCLPAVLLSDKCHGAGELFCRLGVDDGNFLTARHLCCHPHHAAMGADRNSKRRFFESLAALGSANEHGHGDIDAVRTPPIGGAVAGHRGFHLGHQVPPELAGSVGADRSTGSPGMPQSDGGFRLGFLRRISPRSYPSPYSTPGLDSSGPSSLDSGTIGQHCESLGSQTCARPKPPGLAWVRRDTSGVCVRGTRYIRPIRRR